MDFPWLIFVVFGVLLLWQEVVDYLAWLPFRREMRARRAARRAFPVLKTKELPE